MLGNDKEIRKTVDLAIETTLEIQLVSAKMNGMLDLAKTQATRQRAIQREINKGLKETTMFNTIMGNVNDKVQGAGGDLTFRELIMTTKQKNSEKDLFVAVDQSAGFGGQILTFVDGMQDQVERFKEGARKIMEVNANKYFGTSICLENKCTTEANANFDEQDYDYVQDCVITKEEIHLISMGQEVSIDWSDFTGNGIDLNKWSLTTLMDEQSMESQLDDETFATQYTNGTIYPDEELEMRAELQPDELKRYTAADDRDSGASAMET
jgi:hypothetical protein